MRLRSVVLFLINHGGFKYVSSFVGDRVQPTTSCLFAKPKRKGNGGAGKAHALQKLIQERNANLPASQLDFKTAAKPPIATGELDRQAAVLEEQQKHGQRDETLTAAQKMVQAQRASVDMMTHVATRIQSTLDPQELWKLLSSSSLAGFAVVDKFMLSQLQAEATQLFNDDLMVADVNNLAAGEYVLAIQGGQEQYPRCPRMVELVVALTSKFASQWNQQQHQHRQHQCLEQIPPLLDERSCMAHLRTYNAKSYFASRRLLLQDTAAEEDLEEPPFKTVVPRGREDATSSMNDFRTISLCYFLDDQDNGDGGLAFATASTTANTADGTMSPSSTFVPGITDRLVLWRSDTTPLQRPRSTRSQEDQPPISCLELHFLQQQQQ